MNIVFLIVGLMILLLGMADFFFTTLSSSGAGKITRSVAFSADRVLQWSLKIFGRTVFSFSGLFVNLLVLAVWVLMVWAGLFLIFSSDPDAITNSQGKVADVWERLYFTGYVLSTLGIGNYTPDTGIFQVLSSFFSFFGFIFFTSSITYFISLFSGVVNERVLARSINSLGQDAAAIAENFRKFDRTYTLNQLLTLEQLTDRHLINQQAYPVIRFIRHPDKEVSIALNLARLDEAINLLKTDQNPLSAEIEPLRSSISSFLKKIDKSFSQMLPEPQKVPGDFTSAGEVKDLDEKELANRRRILSGLLKSEGFGWKDVTG